MGQPRQAGCALPREPGAGSETLNAVVDDREEVVITRD
jgi:hypothetical protein